MTTLLSMILSSILLMYVSMGLATVTSSQLNANDASKIAIQSLQYADIKANELRAVSYSTIQSKAEAKATISGTKFQREVTIGPETDLGGGAKQRIATVNIYKTGETLPRQAISVPLSSLGSGNSGVPVGTIIIWSTWADPDSDSGTWLECNGQAVNASLYPKLAALMSHTPNYQGVFLRGYGSQYSYHYNSILHFSANLGEIQGDSIRNIIGNMYGSSSEDVGLWDGGSGAFATYNQGRDSVKKSGNYFSYVSQAMSFSADRVVPVSNENRPVNKAVRYLIKAK